MFENSFHSRIATDSKRARKLKLTSSLLWMAFWYTGLLLLFFAEPLPRFLTVWIGLSLTINLMTGVMAGAGKSAKRELLATFIVCFLANIFGMALTFTMERRPPDAFQAWIPGLIFAGIGFALAIAAFAVRWNLMRSQTAI